MVKILKGTGDNRACEIAATFTRSVGMRVHRPQERLVFRKCVLRRKTDTRKSFQR